MALEGELRVNLTDRWKFFLSHLSDRAMDSWQPRSVSSGINLRKGTTLDELEQAINEALPETFIQNSLSSDLFAVRLDPSVPDGTSVFAIGKGKQRAALLISPAKFPNVVSEDQAKARDMRNHLGPALGCTILTPLAEGFILNRSYALMPLGEPLSNNRLFWAGQKWKIKPKLLSWLRNVVAQHNITLDSSDAEVTFQTPLQHLSSVDGVDFDIRRCASNALERLQSGIFRPRVAPMHNDFWKGNILLPRHAAMQTNVDYPFFIIDWRGSRIDGFPFFDLVRLSMSFGLSPDELRREIIATCESLECALVDVNSYLAAALGEISTRLEEFPRERFLQMTRSYFDELRKAGI